MATFEWIEHTGLKYVAVLNDRGILRIDKRALKTRIRDLTEANVDTSEEERALKALEEAGE